MMRRLWPLITGKKKNSLYMGGFLILNIVVHFHPLNWFSSPRFKSFERKPTFPRQRVPAERSPRAHNLVRQLLQVTDQHLLILNHFSDQPFSTSSSSYLYNFFWLFGKIIWFSLAKRLSTLSLFDYLTFQPKMRPLSWSSSSLASPGKVRSTVTKNDKNWQKWERGGKYFLLDPQRAGWDRDHDRSCQLSGSREIIVGIKKILHVGIKVMYAHSSNATITTRRSLASVGTRASLATPDWCSTQVGNASFWGLVYCPTRLSS